VEAARGNLDRNGVTDLVELREAWVDEALLKGLGAWNGITANLERGLLEPLLPGFRDAIQPGGWLIVSGILAEDWVQVVERLEALGFRSGAEDALDDEWRSGLFERVAGLP
ncbi:MAG TPA: 50S ribosomal protein L11 methyltransferase, partial [Longimicrobiales bacterium]